MMRLAQQQNRGRIAGASLAALIHAGLGLLLLHGLGRPDRSVVEQPLEAFEILPPRPDRADKEPARPAEEPRRAERQAAAREEGAAAPPNIVSNPTAVIAPIPIVQPPPPLIVAAPIAGSGIDASSGAAPVRGPGTGAGGVGDGRGSGRGGGGDGGGGGRGGENSPPRLLRELRPGDYPRAAIQAGIGGVVGVIYTVDLNGRAVDCEITRSSGDARLDTDTCALIERRYRYDPSRDPSGRPVYSRIEHDMIWSLERLPPDSRD